MEETIRLLKEHNIFHPDYAYLTMWVRTQESYSVKRVSEVLNVSERTAERLLDKLEQAGLLQPGKRERIKRMKMAELQKPEATAVLSLRFAYHIWSTLSKLHPDNLDLKKAFVDQWEKEARLLIKERNVKDAYNVFKFAIEDEFWQKVILSIKGFRAKYDKIKAKTTTAQPQVQVSNKYLSDD